MLKPPESISQARYHTALHGLINGFAMRPGGRIEHLAGDTLDAALAQADAIVWLHFNVRVGQARDWIARCEHLLPPTRQFLLESDDRKRIERVGDGLIGVISDIRYDFGLDFDPEHIASLRFHLDQRRLISTRRQPCSAVDQLRTEIKSGRHFASTPQLLIHLFESQIAKLGETISHVRGLLDELEDQILAGRMRGQHLKLGGIRRLAVRLSHHFRPEYRMLQHLSRRPLAWFDETDRAALLEVVEEFRELVDDLTETQERAKLLQEEVAARLAEQTNSNLYVLSLFTALLLPPSLIAGIFGMNVAGLPGLKDDAAFWWVIGGMVSVSGSILFLLYWRRFFK